MTIPPHRLARIDQDMAELDSRVAAMVAGFRTISTLNPTTSATELFIMVAASVRSAVQCPDDARTVELLLTAAVKRLAELEAH